MKRHFQLSVCLNNPPGERTFNHFLVLSIRSFSFPLTSISPSPLFPFFLLVPFSPPWIYFLPILFYLLSPCQCWNHYMLIEPSQLELPGCDLVPTAENLQIMNFPYAYYEKLNVNFQKSWLYQRCFYIKTLEWN